MRRTPAPTFFRLACPALFLLALLAGNDSALGPVTPAAGQPLRDCSDPPRACKTPVKYLGENKGCACFACEYGKRTQKILCTRNEADKRAFMLLLPRPNSKRS